MAVDDPMNPEAWFGEPGVCGSCLAWRPGELVEGDEVAVGKCLLRPELRRVPASLRKCAKYQQRGGFQYSGRAERAPEQGKRRKAAAPAVVKVRNADGELVDVTPAAKPERVARVRKPRASTGSTSAPAEPSVPYVRPPDPVYRPFPVAEEVPDEVDLGGQTTAPLVEAALAELIAEEVRGRRRDLHSKFRHGGRVTAFDGDGQKRTVPAHQFFSRIEKLAKVLDSLEEAIDTHPKLEADDEMVGLVRKMRGSFTTFNVMFADREDYFTGKA